MSWNHFPKLELRLLNSSASQFQFNMSLNPSKLDTINPKKCQNQKRKAKTSKLIELPSTNEDKFEQLLKKIEKVTQDFQQNQSSQSNLNSSTQQSSLLFKHTIKALQGEKDLYRSTRRARTMKNIEQKINNSQNFNKVLAQTSPFKFPPTQNSSQRLINIRPRDQYIPFLKMNESTPNLHNIKLRNKQNEPNLKLKQSQETKASQTTEKIKTINFDFNILEKVPLKKSFHFDNIDDFKHFHKEISNFYENLTKEELKFSDFEIGNCIGSGKFGQVYLCKHKKTNFICALKKIMKSTIQQYKMVDQLIRQLKISYLVDHPNIIKTYGHFHDQFHVFMLMEYAVDGCVMDNLQLNKGQEFSSNVVFQTMNGVDYLHRNRIVHRDLKPQNIVVLFKDTYKICDFGLSTYVRNQMKHTICGTADYLSPQMKDVGQYDFSVDKWSLGILSYELVVGQGPFKEKMLEWKRSGWKKGKKWTWKVEYPMGMSELGIEFMEGLLREKVEERESIWSSLRSGWIRKYAGREMEMIKRGGEMEDLRGWVVK